MINYIKIELQRAFKNVKMYIALLIGCMIAIMQVFVDIVPILKYQSTEDFTKFPFTVFEKCLSLINGSMFPVYFFILVPLIAAIPYGTVLYKDRKQGYVKNVFTRTKKQNYYIAQYVAAFLTAGTVAVVPQMLNVLIIALLLPSIAPYSGIGYVGLFYECMWSDIYYWNPYVYLLLFWILDFIFYGLLNTLALSLSWLIKYEFTVLMIPFLAFQALELFASCIEKYEWMPESFLRAAQPMLGSKFSDIFIMMLVMLVISMVSVMYGIHKKDNSL